MYRLIPASFLLIAACGSSAPAENHVTTPVTVAAIPAWPSHPMQLDVSCESGRSQSSENWGRFLPGEHDVASLLDVSLPHQATRTVIEMRRREAGRDTLMLLLDHDPHEGDAPVHCLITLRQDAATSDFRPNWMRVVRVLDSETTTYESYCGDLHVRVDGIEQILHRDDGVDCGYEFVTPGT